MKLSCPRWFIPIAIPALLLAGTLCGQSNADALDPGQKAAAEWIRTRLETTKLETDWSTDRPLLESTIAAMKERAQNLQEKRDQLIAKNAKDRDEIASMEAKNKLADDDLQSATVRLSGVVDRVTALRPALPPRLSEALEMSYRSLRKKGLGASETMQLVMTILGRCEVFNRTISSGEEVLSIDGQSAAKSLQVIYWGLGSGYALDHEAGKAWVGSPGPRGWRWEPAADRAVSIDRLIAIYQDKTDPDLVAVPATLSQPMAGNTLKQP